MLQVKNQNGSTPLHYACWHGQYEVVKFLFDNYDAKGIELDKRNHFQQTAQDFAKAKGHKNITELLEIWHYQSVIVPKMEALKRKHLVSVEDLPGPKRHKPDK